MIVAVHERSRGRLPEAIAFWYVVRVVADVQSFVEHELISTVLFDQLAVGATKEFMAVGWMPQKRAVWLAFAPWIDTSS